jgi:hypothetical protein
MSINSSQLSSEILNTIDNVSFLYDTYLRTNESLLPEKAKEYENFFESLKKNIDEQVLRIAVVGAIKSGKSTFINSFLKSDILKRGAGVITSVVTRVISGRDLKATVHFKSIEEINKDIKNSVVLLPDSDENLTFENFDITDQDSRNTLKNLLEKLKTDQLITKDSREAKSVYLQSYLSGYKRLSDMLDNGLKVFEGDQFEEYKDFASQEPLAVYVKDILVEIPVYEIDENTEIADCQGSDSTNPLHIARIQDYLVRANFIIYLISTRTGLRQADIKFLNMLKKMGLTEQSLFVLNSDLSEHENIEDLKRVEEKTIEEIKMIKPEAEFFTISALYELFKENKEKLSDKDKLRLEQWHMDKKSVEYLHSGFSRFKTYFDNELISRKHYIFYSSCLRKVTDSLSELRQRLELKIKYIKQENEEAPADLKKQEKRFNEIKKLIKNTLEGSKNKFDKTLKNDIDRFFDTGSQVYTLINDFIKTYKNDYDKYITKTGENSVKVNYFSLYQDFKQSLDSYVTQEINPAIIYFVREKEKQIVSYYYELAKSYEYMVSEARKSFDELIDKENDDFKSYLPEPENFEFEKDFNMPSALDALDYNVGIRSSAIAGSGLVFFKNIYNRLFNSNKSINDDVRKTIEKSLEKIKKETEKSIKNHFLNYRENLKFQYILKFSGQVMEVYYNSLINRLDSYISDFSNIQDLLEKNAEIKKEYVSELNQIYDKCKIAEKDVSEIFKKINEK